MADLPASQELVPSQEPAMPVMPAGRNTRGRAQTKKTRLVEHTTQEEETPEGDQLEIHQVRQVQEVVKKIAFVRGRGRGARGAQQRQQAEEEEQVGEEQEEEEEAGADGDGEAQAAPSRRTTRRQDAELRRAMEHELEPMGAKPASARRTWKRVVVEGGTAPEPAGAEVGEEGEEEPVGQELQQAQQAVSAGGSPGASRRSRRSARSQPSYHTERVVTDIPATEALEPQIPAGVLEAAMDEIAAGAAGEEEQEQEFGTPGEQLQLPEATPEGLAPEELAPRTTQRLRTGSAGLASQLEQEQHLMGAPEGIAQARRRAAAPATAAEGQEQEEEGAPGPSRTPTVPRKRKAPGADAAAAAVAAAVGRGARRGRLFPREEEQGKGKAAAPAEEEEEEEEQEEEVEEEEQEEEEEEAPPTAPARGVLGAAEAVSKAIRSVLAGGGRQKVRQQEEEPAAAAAPAPARKTRGAKAPPAKKAAPKGGKKKRGGGKQEESYKRYVHRVLSQVHPELNISRKAMDVMQSFMTDAFEQIADEAARLTRYSKRATLSAREVQTSVRLVLPGELGRHAVLEGKKAVARISGLQQ